MRSRGFTLIEILLVILLVSAVFFPLLHVFSTGLLVSSDVKGSNTAVILAQQKLEELRNAPYTAITSEVKSAITDSPAYSRQIIVNEQSTNLKDVTVIVYWKPGEGSETSVSIETYITNY